MKNRLKINCISENYLEDSANLKQGTHIHQPTVRTYGLMNFETKND